MRCPDPNQLRAKQMQTLMMTFLHTRKVTTEQVIGDTEPNEINTNEEQEHASAIENENECIFNLLNRTIEARPPRTNPTLPFIASLSIAVSQL